MTKIDVKSDTLAVQDWLPRRPKPEVGQCIINNFPKEITEEAKALAKQIQRN